MNFRKLRFLAGTASLSVIAAFGANAAHAQDAGAPPRPAERPTATTYDDSATIIVTGSRIARPETANANPVVSLSADRLQESGTTNVTQYLKTIPALVGSSGGYDNSGSRAGIGYTGLNLLNLRNLGYDRTLVLIDGRRHVGSVDGLQAVDINTIPEDLIERVEILTGGASAIYGADAVSGAVNFIMKRDFEGINGRAQAGISARGDAGQRLVSLTAGKNFADGRGNFTLSWEHGEEDRLDVRQRGYLSGTARVGFYKNPADTEAGTDSTNDGIFDNIPLNDVRYFDTSRAGGIDVNFDGMPDFFGANGAPYDNGTYIPDYYQQGGSGTLVSDYGNDLLPQVKRDVFNAFARFEFSEALELYAEAKYAKTKSFSLQQPTFDYYLFIPQDNPYIPANLQPVIDDIGIGAVLVNRDNFDFGQRGEDITRETIRAVLGAKGALTPHLKYDVSYVFGQTDVTNHYIGNILTDRFYAAIDAVEGPNGPTCRINIDPEWEAFQPYNYTRSVVPTTTFSPGSCQPLNLFGEGLNSKAALDWIKTDTVDRTRVNQHVVSAALTGDTGGFFKLPGGPASFAIGGEYRKEKSRFIADPLAQQGLTFGNQIGNSIGEFDVKEAYAEVSLPLLSAVPFAHVLTVGGAVRFSDYSSIGTTTAWKVDGTWAPVPDVAFRGTYSVAVRAPNISELYGAAGQTFLPISDPCNIGNVNKGTQYRAANCTALLTSLGADPSVYVDTRSNTLPGLLTSNPGVREEKAKTWTAGVILRPSFIPRLVITADWYDIKIENAIVTASANELAELCVDQPTLDNQYCGLITRTDGGEDAGYINGFTLKPFNVAAYRTAGLDVTLDYTIPTDTLGTFRIHLVGNYLDKLSFTPIPGAPVVNDAYTGGGDQTNSPKYQATADLGWKKGLLNVNWRMTYFSKTYRYSRQEMSVNPDVVAPQYLEYKAKFVNDIYVAADVTEQFQIYAGMNNVFDIKPDLGSQVYPVDAVGRFFYVGARVKLGNVFK